MHFCIKDVLRRYFGNVKDTLSLFVKYYLGQTNLCGNSGLLDIFILYLYWFSFTNFSRCLFLFTKIWMYKHSGLWDIFTLHSKMRHLKKIRASGNIADHMKKQEGIGWWLVFQQIIEHYVLQFWCWSSSLLSKKRLL